jgi:hypothetical protein
VCLEGSKRPGSPSYPSIDEAPSFRLPENKNKEASLHDNGNI